MQLVIDSMRFELERNLSVPLTGLLIQLLVILVFSRACGWALKFFGQPQVIGEMIAGILLGKSVLAPVWPSGFAVIFPDSAMPRLYFLSQIGLIFFMFVIGLELKLSEIKQRAWAAFLVSNIGIVVPFALGVVLAFGIHDQYAPPQIPFYAFGLFMGIAMSITAFPVLARILQEKNLMGTRLGTMAITCAAVQDVTVWCLLAAIVGIVKAGSAAASAGVLFLAAVYIVFILFGVRPFLTKALGKAARAETLSGGQLALAIMVLLGSALISEMVGIHALFGAFLAGVTMPPGAGFRTNLTGKIEDFSAVVLLPVFFTYTGIRTQIGLLSEARDWIIAALIIATAITGKLLGSAIAARFAGMSWRESWALGALMNTRGLMELIVLNIGYDLGILSPAIFAMLVVMAVVTTVMTGPMLNLTAAKPVAST